MQTVAYFQSILLGALFLTEAEKKLISTLLDFGIKNSKKITLIDLIFKKKGLYLISKIKMAKKSL